MYLERIRRASTTERGVQLTFSCGDTEQSIELSLEAAQHILRALLISEAPHEEQLTLTVFGHQVVRRPDAYGLLLRTQELGDVVFSLPQAILCKLASDLMHLGSSSPNARSFKSESAAGYAPGKTGLRHS